MERRRESGIGRKREREWKKELRLGPSQGVSQSEDQRKWKNRSTRATETVRPTYSFFFSSLAAVIQQTFSKVVWEKLLLNDSYEVFHLTDFSALTGTDSSYGWPGAIEVCVIQKYSKRFSHMQGKHLNLWPMCMRFVNIALHSAGSSTLCSPTVSCRQICT